MICSFPSFSLAQPYAWGGAFFLFDYFANLVIRFGIVSFLLLLAGCVQPVAHLELVENIDYALGDETCSGVFFARIPEFSETDPWLPPGFTAADASTVIKETGTDLNQIGRAFMGGFAAQCETYRFNNYWIAVEPPSLADQEGLHWFELAAYFDGAPVTMNMHGADILPMESTYITGTYEGTFSGNDGKEILDITGFGVANLLSLNEHLNFWQVTDTGTLVLEGYVNVKAQSGDAVCSSDYQWIREFSAECAGDSFISGTLPTMAFGGTYRFFDGQFPE